MSPNSSPGRAARSPRQRTESESGKRSRHAPAHINNSLGFPLLTTEHTPQNVALNAFGLGVLAGLGIALRWTECMSLATTAYCVLASVGLILEYITRAMLKQEQGLKSFVIGGKHRDNLFLYLGPIEYALRWMLFPTISHLTAVSSVGVILAIAAQNVRTFSLIGLGSSPQDRSALRIARLALRGWQISIQIVLCNPLCLAGQCMFGTASSPGRSQPESGLGPLGLPIFDGHHTPQNIAAHAYLLGCLHGFGVGLGFCSTDFRGLGFFVGSLALFHVLEYLCTAMYRSDVKMSAFLLNNGREYQMAMAAGVVEYFVWYFVYPPMNAFRWWNWIALMGMVAAQYLRSAAMITAGSNFTHLIAAEKDPSHTLVTTGIYATFRHPSYTAFYYWAVCTQLTANNPFCSLAFSLALYKFFRDRIIYEERTLIEFFGDEYERYIKTAKVWIPYIE